MKVIKQVLRRARILIFCLIVSGMVSQQLSATYDNGWLVPSKKTIAIGAGVLGVAWAGHGYWKHQRNEVKYKKAAKIIEEIPRWKSSPLNVEKPQASLTYKGLEKLKEDLGLGKKDFAESNPLKVLFSNPLLLFFTYPYEDFLNNYEKNITNELDNRKKRHQSTLEKFHSIQKDHKIDWEELYIDFNRIVGNYFPEKPSKELINFFSKNIISNDKIELKKKIDFFDLAFSKNEQKNCWKNEAMALLIFDFYGNLLGLYDIIGIERFSPSVLKRTRDHMLEYDQKLKIYKKDLVDLSFDHFCQKSIDWATVNISNKIKIGKNILKLSVYFMQPFIEREKIIKKLDKIEKKIKNDSSITKKYKDSFYKRIQEKKSELDAKSVDHYIDLLVSAIKKRNAKKNFDNYRNFFKDLSIIYNDCCLKNNKELLNSIKSYQSTMTKLLSEKAKTELRKELAKIIMFSIEAKPYNNDNAFFHYNLFDIICNDVALFSLLNKEYKNSSLYKTFVLDRTIYSHRIHAGSDDFLKEFLSYIGDIKVENENDFDVNTAHFLKRNEKNSDFLEKLLKEDFLNNENPRFKNISKCLPQLNDAELEG